MNNMKLLLIISLSIMGTGLFAQIIPDDNFRYKINQALGQSPTYEPTIEDLNSLSEYLNAADASIVSIEGAQYLVNLAGVGLHRNQIINISVLSGLTNLTSLMLQDNQISDISALSGLTNLITLKLQDNQISDISALSGMIDLNALYLNENQICDISALSGMINLFYLHLQENQISDISALSGTTHLSGLFLEHNQISDISALSNLTNPRSLKLQDNQISDISALSGLTNLLILYLNENQISDISALSGLTNLVALYLHDNHICDISTLSDLIDLEYLFLNDNQISNITPLSSLTDLRYLMLSGNQITDISALVENVGFGFGDELFLEYYGMSNPLSLEALEVHIPILQNQGFYSLTYPDEPNLNAACYPSPIRHAENVAYNIELSWQGSEFDVTYEVCLGLSNENLINIGYGQFTSDSTFTFSPELLPDTEYWWRIKSTNEDEVLWSGMWHFTTGNYTAINNDTVDIPKDTNLKSAYPNPFNPSTSIEFSIQNDSKVELTIFNIKGQKIKILANNEFSEGSHSIIWNGDDESNKPVSSGIYYYKLSVNGKTEAVRKCLLLK